jgi:hypothetical protein
MRGQFGEGDGAEQVEHGEHAQEEEHIPDAVHEKGAERGQGHVLLLPIMADEQVGAQAHAFPAQEDEHQVVRQDQGEHGGDEQVQAREETPLLGIMRI